MSTLTHFGIRHHGPGSARSLVAALTKLQPDIVLIEGPPEANDLITWVKHEEMQPPVAILIYEPADPQQAVFYPFAVFSPEWQALLYSLEHSIPARFIDLPQSHRMAFDPPEPSSPDSLKDATDPIRQDPLGQLAIAAGYSDGERWWDMMVESRQDSSDLFAAISEAMVALREEVNYEDTLEDLREASMRQAIRKAKKDGFANIAVVCGAWHVPALLDLPPAKQDSALLKGLAKKKVDASWVPWTYGRLSYRSGYGAGISSPGWYQHVWETHEHLSTHWLTKVAQLFRQKDLTASSAHIIEGVRLAEALAALRGKAMPGLEELNEATQTVFCFGSDVPMKLIEEQLVISEKLGEIPTNTPMLPLQRDLQSLQRRLLFKPKASEDVLELDLRKPLHLERSQLLHRLDLLGIPWGRPESSYGKKGSFHEHWRTAWQPDFEVRLIEMTIWGNTVMQAAQGLAVHQAKTAQILPELSQLLNSSLLADLGDAVGIISQQLERHAAQSSDMLHLLEALPPLVQVMRYGNVRQTDASMVSQVIKAIMPRISIGLPPACTSLDDEAAAQMIKAIMAVQQALLTLQEDSYLQIWYHSLVKLSQQRGLHPLLAGRTTRLLLDSQQITSEASITSLRLALNLANEPLYAAHWLEGFLSGSGLILIHDEVLWQVLDDWVRQLHHDDFDLLVPLLRRTFSTFSKAERRQLGQRVGSAEQTQQGSSANFDEAQAERVMPLVRLLLGLETEP